MLGGMLLAVLLGQSRAARSGGLSFATTLGDNMVLQASPHSAVVWGPLGDTAKAVSVSCRPPASSLQNAAALPVHATTSVWLGLRIWTAKLPPVDASFATYTITATPDVGPAAQLSNVSFGEVWLCSGQSNMGYTIAGDTHCFNKTRNADGSPNCSKEIYGTCGGRSCVWNAGREVADMKNYPHIRLMDVRQPSSPNYKPQFKPIPQAPSTGWHRPDQYADVCRGNHSDCRPDAWGERHCGCTNYTSVTGCCSPDADGIWRQDSSGFSAACWFFARDLYESLDPPRPVGVMNNAVGGTADQLWSSPAAIDSCKHLGEPWEWPSNYSSSELWNALVVPLSRHVIKGVVWYQGEQNTATGPPGGGTQSYWCFQCLKGAVNCTSDERVTCETPQNPSADGRTYLCSFAAMVKSWRELWKQNTASYSDSSSNAFSFGWAQLNSNGRPDTPRAPAWKPQPLRNSTGDPLGAWAPGFPSLRWAQTQSLQLIPDSFQAVILDTPSPSGAIHSCFKQQVGSRLARGALAAVYSRPELQSTARIAAAAAQPAAARGQGGQEQVVVVKIANTSGSSLTVRASLGFEVLVQEMWYSAPIVHSDGADTLQLSLANVTGGGTAVALRYLWGSSPCGRDILQCPVYVTVPKLGALTGENDSLPLGPAVLPISGAQHQG